MANNEINIKLTADQKIERLRSGKPLYVESALDTSGGKHEYVIKDEDIKKFLANQKVERLSATQITSLLQTGYSSFDEQIDALNKQLSSAVGEEKKKIQAALTDAKQIKYFSDCLLFVVIIFFRYYIIVNFHCLNVIFVFSIF